jgi:ABC-2 type transport system ATP-binding protein
MQPAIQITDLSVRLGGQLVLKDLSVELPAGRITGLLGPSGAGKTTLIRTIVGRQRVATGSVTVLGQPAGSAPLRPEIGYVTQAPSVYGDLTVTENLRYFAAMVGATKVRVQEVLKDVGLAPQARQLVGTLSGGQKSRVSLAVALLGRPKLLVLDEPTVGIDPLLRRDLWNQFRKLAEQGTTLLVSSHVMDEASHCDHLLLLRGGALLAYGTIMELTKKAGATDVEGVFLKLIGDDKR